MPLRARSLRVGLWITCLLLVIGLSPVTLSSVRAQQDLISMGVNAGYDGYFREDFWVPLLISVTNNGDPIEGKLIARPERSTALTGTFSTPVSLATGGRQTAFLYVTLKSFASSVLVELMDNTGTIVTDIEVPLRAATSRDELYVVVSSATSSVIDLTRLATGGNQAFQANWFPSNIPDRAGALDAVNMMVFSNADSGTLTPAQRGAIEEWVIGGGHLVVTGGANWQPAAVAFTDLLPFTPSGTTPVDDLTSLARFAGDYNTALTGNYIATSGSPSQDAAVLATSGDNQPLLLRRQIGNGVVDYLNVDPSTEPLRSWTNQNQMWLYLLTTEASRPGWTYGFNDIDQGINSIEILPGFSALPEVTAMVGFLVLYIVLVGPVNYLILRRLNRREFAWLTIPVLILIFSGLAWATGFNLRGNDVILSRMSVVQSWANQDIARSEQLIGLLAPRRANYTLAVEDDRLLRPVARTTQSGQFFGNTSTGSSIEINQSSRFAALNFPVDASFIAAFATNGALKAPEINGQATISYQIGSNQQTLRGTIRNDSELTLSSAVILARGQAIRLPEPLKPGDLYVFGEANAPLYLENDGPVSPSPLEYTPGDVYTAASRYYSPGYLQNVVSYQQSLNDIIGTENFTLVSNGFEVSNQPADQETDRRYKFLSAFMADEFNATGRGDRVYLVGWSNQAPFEENLTGVNWRSVDSTIYIIELATEIVYPAAGTRVTVTPDQFTWTAIEREGILDAAPTNLTLYTDRLVSFRFTPLPQAVLKQVSRLDLVLDQGDDSVRYRPIQIELWNWKTGEWQMFETTQLTLPIANPARFIGPNNAVQVRINRDLAGGYLYINRLGIQQHGEF